MEFKEAIAKWLGDHQEELVDLAAQLIRARSENPPGNEGVPGKVLTQFFDRHKIPWEAFESAPGRMNIVGRVGNGGKSLFVPGHLDTVPAGDDWTVPPFEGLVRDGQLYGRGAADNKGPTAAVMIAGACLHHVVPLAGTLLLGGVADEERGSALGLEWMLANAKVRPDMAIVPDIGGNMRKIDVAEKGLMVVRIVSHGKQAHGSRPELGINAIWNLLELLRRFRQEGVPAASHALLGQPSHNLGRIEGGTASNVVPARAEAVVDVRFLPGQTEEDILSVFSKIAARIEAEMPGARFEISKTMAIGPTEVDPDNPLVRTLRETTREITGREAELFGSGGVTVTKQLLLRGIPAIGFGAGDAGQAHMQDEHIEIAELTAFAKVMAVTAARLLGTR